MCVPLTLLRSLFLKLNTSKNAIYGSIKNNLYGLSTNITFDKELRFQPLKLVWVHASSTLYTFTNLKFTDSNITLYLIKNLNTSIKFNYVSYYFSQNQFKTNSIGLLTIVKSTFGDGFLYLRGLFIIFFIDASITDDEPL
jgi:hypothetical protein